MGSCAEIRKYLNQVGDSDLNTFGREILWFLREEEERARESREKLSDALELYKELLIRLGVPKDRLTFLDEAENQIQSLAFAQKRQEALAFILEGEVANMAARREMVKVRDEASTVDAKGIVETAEVFVKGYEHSLSLLNAARDALESLVSEEQSYEDSFKMVDTVIATIDQIRDPKRVAEDAAVFIGQAKQNIALRKKLKQRGINPDIA